MRVTADLKGDRDFVRAIARLGPAATAAASAALYEEGLGVDADMVPRIPVATGRLRSTHYVAPPTEHGSEILVEVGVGTDYAVPVHERTEARHGVGEAKFLERAVQSRAPGMAARLAKRTLHYIEQGGGVVPLRSDPPARPRQSATRDARGRFKKRSDRG